MKRTALAKITRPNPGEIFSRNRLFRKMDMGACASVIFITGPPGSGKTSLVTSYLDNRSLRALWYQVDERDADPATFFYYMGLAVQKAAPRYKKPLPLFTPEYDLGLRTFTRSYFENLCSRLKPPCVLVFDDYQETPSDSPFHEIIRTGISTFPENISCIITSRLEPPPALAGMRAGKGLCVIGWEDLKLTRAESKGIARLERTRKPFPKRGFPKMYDWLHEKADGWAAGLVLLARAVKSVDVDRLTLNSSAPLSVFHYFAGELFNTLDHSLQDFLLKTAFMQKIEPALAETLTGNTQAEEILARLNRKNYFTEKLDQQNVVYQYQSLFREFLISEAESRFTEEELFDLRLKAAKLLEASDQMEDAAALFLDAGAWKHLITLINTNAPVLMRQGRNAALETWITAIPAQLLEDEPWMNFWLGSCRLGSNPVESRKFLERAFELFVSCGDDAGAFLAWSGIVQTYIYVFDDFSSLDFWISWLDERGGKDAVFPSLEIELIVAAGMTAALSWRDPGHPEIEAWVDRAISLCRKDPGSNIEACTRAYTNCAVHYIWKGRFDECGLLIDEMKRMIDAQPVSPLRFLVFNHTKAMFYNTSAETQQQALRAVSEGLDEAERTGVHVIDSLFYNQGVIASLSGVDLAQATEFLLKLEKTLHRGSRTHVANYHYLSAYHQLMTGERHRAVVSAGENLRLAREAGVPFSEIIARLALSHALNAAGDQDEAERELASAWPVIMATSSFYFEYLYWLTDAYFKYARKNETAGRKSLKKAMMLGRSRGFITQLNLWRPDVMAFLCGKALEAGIEVDYVKDLIRKLNLTPDDESIEMESWPWPVKIYLLGRFQVFIDDEPVQFSGKIQKKPLMLLKALVTLGGGEVQAEQIEDVLWPEAEGDEAHNSFDTTLHRLRKWIGHPDAFRFGSGVAEMDRKICWTDVWAFESLIEKAGMEEKQGRLGRTLDLTEKAVSLYKGTLLPGEANEPWTVSPRERLRRKFLKCVTWLGRRHEDAGEWEKAVSCYDRGLEADDIYEEFYQHIMLCYQHLGRKAEALATYERCRKVLSARLGVKPSTKTEKLRKSLR